MQSKFLVILLSTLVIFNGLSCQRRTTKTDQDSIDEAVSYLDEGDTQKAIEILTPIAKYNNSPRVMALIASAYLYRSQISTREIIDLFLNFSVTGAKTADLENQKLREFTQIVAALDNFFLKLAVVPQLKNESQEVDLKIALNYLKSATPSTPGIALQRGLVRLILAKYIFISALNNLIKPQINTSDNSTTNRCEFAWTKFYDQLYKLLDLTEEIIADLKEANPKRAGFWAASLESIGDTRNKINNIKGKELSIDPLAQDLFIYFLNTHKIDLGCTP